MSMFTMCPPVLLTPMCRPNSSIAIGSGLAAGARLQNLGLSTASDPKSHSGLQAHAPSSQIRVKQEQAQELRGSIKATTHPSSSSLENPWKRNDACDLHPW
jgi:hypothetical protein